MCCSKSNKLFVRRAGVFAIVLAAIVMFRWYEHSQVYHPTRELEPLDAASARLLQDVYFDTSDGVKLNAWFFPAPAGSARAQWAFLICHGNGGNISDRLDLSKTLLAQTGANVLLFDYRGYGRSGGRPDEEGTYRDAQAAFGWLRQRGFTKVIVLGESLGGGVGSELALREPVAGLILQSTFTSIPDIGRELFPWLPVRLISTIKYDTRNKLPRIKAPVLFMHSRTDDLIGFHHAERNFEAASEPKTFCELNGVHNEAVWEQPQYMTSVINLLDQAQADRHSNQ